MDKKLTALILTMEECGELIQACSKVLRRGADEKSLKDLQDEYSLTYLFISHDLSVVAHVCDIVAVMYLGHIVEMAPSRELFSNPKHPYTKALLSSIPSIDPENKSKAIELEGEIPSAMNPPSGCVFRTRCPHASHDGKEANVEMGLVEVTPGHWVDRCGVNCA